MQRPLPSVLLAALVLLDAGCASAPVYRVHVGRVHKDLIVCNVHLSAALSAEEYSRIAGEELGTLLKSPVATPENDLPLYEARFEFLVTNPGDDSFHKVATVRFTLLDPDDPPRIILYPAVF